MLPRSIRGRVALLVVSMVAMLTGLYAQEGYRRFLHAKQDVRDRIVLAAEAVAASTEVTLAHADEAMSTLAERFGRPALADRSRCREIMTTAVAALSYIALVAAVDDKGALVCSTSPPPPGATTNFSDREWFRRLVRTRSFTVGPPVLGRISQREVVTIAAPVLGDGGRLLGAVAAGMEVARFQELVDALDLSSDWLVTIATEQRTIVARSHDPDRWMGRTVPPVDSSFTEEVVGPGRSITRAPDLEGVPRTFGRVDLPGVGWTVWAGLPDTVVASQLMKNAETDFFLGFGVLLLAWLLGVWFYRAVSGPLEVLAGSVRDAAAGEPIPIPAKASIEVVNVVEALNRALEERIRAEEEAHSARDRYRAIVDAAVFGIYLSTLDGRFLNVNPALASMLGYDSVDELLAVSVANLYRDPSVRGGLLRSAVQTGRIEDLEVEWLRKDGEPIVLRLNGTLVRTDDGVPAFEVIVENVSESRRLEELRLRQQSMEIVARLAGGVAHEFNNLLTVIRANAELMREGLHDDNVVAGELHAIVAAAQRADVLTARLLAFSQQGVESPDVLDPDDVIREMSPILEDVLEESVQLELSLEAGPCRVWMDRGRLEQILLNLVLNAHDALPEGGRVTIHTACRQDGPASAEEAGSDRFVVISVSDDGMGMEPEVRARACEPFFTTKPVGQGTGLGLSAVHGIVTRIGGRVDIESEPGRGCTVQVWLPVRESPATNGGKSRRGA